MVRGLWSNNLKRATLDKITLIPSLWDFSELLLYKWTMKREKSMQHFLKLYTHRSLFPHLLALRILFLCVAIYNHWSGKWSMCVAGRGWKYRAVVEVTGEWPKRLLFLWISSGLGSLKSHLYVVSSICLCLAVAVYTPISPPLSANTAFGKILNLCLKCWLRIHLKEILGEGRATPANMNAKEK